MFCRGYSWGVPSPKERESKTDSGVPTNLEHLTPSMMSRHSEWDDVHSTSYCAKKEDDHNYDKRAGAGGKPEWPESLEDRSSWEAKEEMGSMSIYRCSWGSSIPTRGNTIEPTYSHIVDGRMGETT